MKLFSILICAALFGTLPPLLAQGSRQDLDEAIARLSEVRSQIEAERIPLAKELSRLEKEAAEKRIQADQNIRLTANLEVDLSSLEELIQRLKNENSSLSASLSDYIRTFESRIHVSERQFYRDPLQSAKATENDLNLTMAEKLRAQLNAVDVAFERLDSSIQGHSFAGRAIMPRGEYEEGTFVTLGPVCYFVSASGQSGLPAWDITSQNAIVTSISDRLKRGISGLVNTKQGIVPVDATLGDAFKIEATRETQLEEIKKGGLVMYPILGLATFAFTVAIFKWFEIGSVRQAREQDLRIILQHLKAGEKEKAIAQAKSVKGPSGELLTTAVANAEAELSLIEEVLYEKILKTQPRLERMLPLIAVTAATAPLFGLLGTVTGMIKTFNLITVFGTGDASNLSSGISEALITTKFGLIIAIPSLILYTLLSRKAKGVLTSMEQISIGFLNGLNNNRGEEKPSV